MSSELRAAILYLGGFQLMIVGWIAKIPGMLYLGIVNTVFLLLFMLFFGSGIKFFKKQGKNSKTESELRNAFHRWNRFIFAHIFYSGVFYLLTLSFLLRPFMTTIRWRIIIFILGVMLVFMSFISHFSFDKIYFIRKLMIPIDYVLGFSVMIFGLVSFLFKDGVWFIQYGIASLLAILFTLVIAKAGKLLYKNTISKFIFIKLYIIVFVISLFRFGFREWTVINGGLSSSWEQKINFVEQDLNGLIEELGYGKIDLGKKMNIDFENKSNNQTRNSVLTGTGNIVLNKSLTGISSGCSDFEIGSQEMKKCINNNKKGETKKLTGNNINTGILSGSSFLSGKLNQFSGKLEDFITWRDLLHYLFSSGDLIDGAIKFTNIYKNDKDYRYFVTAYKLHMIGVNTLPDNKVSCEIYMVVLGLQKGRNVKIIDRNDIFTPYWKKAEELGFVKGCVRGNFVKFKNL